MPPILPLAAGRVLLATAVYLISTGMAAARQPAVPGYSDFETLQSQVRSIAQSDYAEVETLAETLGGRPVYLLKIGAKGRDERPAVLVVGGVHPPHLLGSELAVRLARKLIEGAASDPEVRRMLQRTTFYIIPRPAPDAMEAFFQQPHEARIRNQRPVDDDGDGRVDEDGPNDLDGDGWITQLRVEDAAGEYIAHPRDNRVMIKADPQQNERGQFAIYTEGADDDRDDELNEDPPGGVAFNRNFTFQYPYFGDAAGPYQISEAETRAVADFAFKHPNIAAVLTFTPLDNLMHLWKVDAAAEKQKIKTTLLADDVPYYKHVAEQYREAIGRKDAPEADGGEGAFSRWAYFHYGRWSFAAGGWWIPKIEAESQAKKAESETTTGKAGSPGPAKDASSSASAEKRGTEDLDALRWFEKQGIDGFVAWKPVDHPLFPGRKTEVGGFKPFLRLNPPAGELDGIAEKHWQFVRKLAADLPRLAIRRAEAESQGGGVWRVTIEAVNEGELATMPRMGEVIGQPHPLQAELLLPKGASLLTGHARVRLAPLHGGGGRAEKSWLIRMPEQGLKSLRVRVWSPSAGSVEKAVEPAGAGATQEI